MSAPWQISDLLDLDFFFSRSPEDDKTGGAADPSAFDRAAYLAYTASHSPPFDRRELIRYWLDEKRALFSESRSLPGELYNETMTLARILAAMAAFFSGAVLSWSVLSYSGATPINIFTCLWVMIVPQLLLLGLLGISTVLSRMGVKRPFKSLYPLLFMLLRRLAERAGKTGQNIFPYQTRQRFNSLTDLAGRRNTPYGPVLFWPVFLLAQFFGLWFNLGLLAATGLKLAVTDLAFGWQSTLVSDPALVLRMVDLFSRPWSWVTAAAHPSISQIEGSRMILKEGIVHLATPDLVSWWPFLIFAIICYGLIPRFLLLIWGYWKRHRALAAVSFSTGACDRLLQRMQTPRLQSTEPAEPGRTAVPQRSTTPPTTFPEPGNYSSRSMGPGIALVPEEIAHLFTEIVLKDRIAAALGLDMKGRVTVEQESAGDETALKHLLEALDTPPEHLRLVVVTEAWQPPLRETVSWLAGMRQAAGPRTGLIVGLVGKPEGNNRYTSPQPMDRKIWEQSIKSLKDPFIRVEDLGDGHG